MKAKMKAQMKAQVGVQVRIQMKTQAGVQARIQARIQMKTQMKTQRGETQVGIPTKPPLKEVKTVLWVLKRSHPSSKEMEKRWIPPLRWRRTLR